MLTDAERLLIGMCRSYMKLKAIFGEPGQPTFMRFPSIQGTAMRRAVEAIAGLPADLTRIDVDELVADLEKKAVTPPNREEADHAP